MNIAEKLAQEFGIRLTAVEQTISLIDEGNTIPFIARYRKEVTRRSVGRGSPGPGREAELSQRLGRTQGRGDQADRGAGKIDGRVEVGD